MVAFAFSILSEKRNSILGIFGQNMDPVWKRNAKMTFIHYELRSQRESRVLTQLSLNYRCVSTQNRKRRTLHEALDLLPHVGICVSGFLRRVRGSS